MVPVLLAGSRGSCAAGLGLMVFSVLLLFLTNMKFDRGKLLLWLVTLAQGRRFFGARKKTNKLGLNFSFTIYWLYGTAQVPLAALPQFPHQQKEICQMDWR